MNCHKGSAASAPDAAGRQALVASFGGRALDEGLDLDALLGEAAAHAAAGLGLKRAKVLRYRSASDDLLVCAGTGWDPGVVGHVTLSADLASPPGRALRTKESVAIADIRTTDGFTYSNLLRTHGIVAVLNVPVRVGETIWGVLEADGEVERCFDQEHMHFLQALANLLGAAIRRFQVESRLREHIAALQTAQAASHESREQLRALAENLPAGMVYQIMMRRDGSERRFTYISRNCVRLTGVAAEAALADPGALYGTILLEHRPALTAAEAVAIRDLAPFDFEVPFRPRDDGEVRWCRIISAPRERPSGLLLWDGLFIDITDRKRAEEALREEARSLEVLNRTGALLTAELDLDRIVQAVTDAATELSGAAFGAFFYNTVGDSGDSLTLYTISGVPRAAFADFPMPRSTAVFGPTFRGEGIVRSDDILADPRYGKNPPYRGMPEGHLPVRSYLAVPVISRSGETLGGLYFGHPQPAVFTVRAERLVVGIAAHAAIAIDNSRLYQAAQRELAARAAAEADLQCLNETLEQRVATATAERSQAEEALRQAQKMEAIGQLTGGLAHDFNNLLQGIVGSLEMLRSRAAAGRTTDLGRYVDAALASADRATALTHRLLAFARRQPLDPKPVDANRLVGALEDLVRRTVGPAIQVETVLAGGLWPTLCDPNQLENALLNLAINARDAMPGGGRLTIETANAHLDDAYAAAQRTVTPGQYVALCVTDTGTGMLPEVMARVFDPFFTTKPLGQGTGLGLSMVYGFVKQSNGHVRIYSEEGCGTTVKLYLPRYRGQAGDETKPETVVSGERARAGETVLVVEDEALVRMLIVEVLEELGYASLEAGDGTSALRVLGTDTHLDLLITDVGLPGGMNGRQLAEAARELRPNLQVLFITGYAQNAAIGNRVLEPGMAMMTKPFALDALAVKIRAMIEKGDGKDSRDNRSEQ